MRGHREPLCVAREDFRQVRRRNFSVASGNALTESAVALRHGHFSTPGRGAETASLTNDVGNQGIPRTISGPATRVTQTGSRCQT
jgi:hypothetical protein